jgi:hypothetical protein
MDLPNPVIRSHYGNGFVKQYVRDHLLLRTDPASNNVHDYGCKKAVENLPRVRKKMSAVIDNYHHVQQNILETFVDRGQLRKLAEPTVLPNNKRIPGLKQTCKMYVRSAASTSEGHRRFSFLSSKSRAATIFFAATIARAVAGKSCRYG